MKTRYANIIIKATELATVTLSKSIPNAFMAHIIRTHMYINVSLPKYLNIAELPYSGERHGTGIY